MSYIVPFDVAKLYLKINNKMDIRVNGFSMEPLLIKDDVVTVEKVDTPNLGDIVIFSYNENLLIHRLIGYKENKYVLKGDNSYNIEIINKSDILGVAKEFKRKDIKILLDNEQFIDIIVELSRMVHLYWINNNRDIIKAHRNWRRIILNFVLKDYIKYILNYNQWMLC